MRIQKAGRTLADLADIAAYLSEVAGSNTGERFLQAAERAFAEIAEMPHVGWHWKSSNTRLKGLRVWSVPGFNDYLIFYRAASHDLEIWRVIHGSRDLLAKDVEAI